MSEFPEDWAEIAWAKLPVKTRRAAVDRLKAAYNPSFFEDVRKLAEEQGLGNWLPPMWHHMQGMHVRNVLRSDHAFRETRKSPRWWRLVGARPPRPVLDTELPTLPEIYGQPVSTWDDFYIQCIEAAAGLRKVDDDSTT